MKFAGSLSRLRALTLSGPVVILFGTVLIGLVAILDYATGTETGFSLFYLIPVSFVTWNAGRRWGMLTAVSCTVVWLLNDTWFGHHQYSHPAIPFWNAGIRFGYFTIVSFLVDHAKGFGVGLRVVKDILDSHETHLEISSTPGIGSRFYFSLPPFLEEITPPSADAPVS